MAELKDLIVYGPSNLIGESFTDIIHANKFMTNGGTAQQLVKGDGTLIAISDIIAGVPTYTAGNGIDITSNVVSVKLDSSNANGLGTTSSGLKLGLASPSSSGTGGSAGAMAATDKENLNTIYSNYLKAGNTIGTISLTEFNPVSDTVHVTAQSLGTTQQETARGNINAQETLVSGTNIKTINGQSLLGSGNIAISGGGGGGSITIDTELSASSTNPVENRVITNALNGKVSDVQINGSSVVSSGIATIPANTDTMVTQTVTASSGSSNWRGILIGASNNSSETGTLTTTTDTSLIFSELRYQPSTGTLKATTFKGNLTGNVTGNVTGTASGNLTSSSTLDPTKLSGYSSTGTKYLRQDGTWQTVSSGGGTATDVQINSTSITNNNTANLAVDGTYNSSTNKIASMSSLSSYVTKTGNDAVSGFKTFTDITCETFAVADGGSFVMKRMINSVDRGAYLFIGYDSTNSEPTLGFYGNANDEKVRFINIEEPRSSSDAATKNYVDTKAILMPTGGSTGQYLQKTASGVQWATVSGGTATTVQINGTSITSNNVANILTNTAYNASTNKIATMSDVPAAPGTLNTNNTTAQTASSSEALSGTIKLHKVAKTGTYSDLIGTPTIPAAPGTLNTNNTTAQTASSSEALSGTIKLHKVAKTGTYSDLIGTPTIPTVNNSTITIQKNSTTVDSFTTNASSAKSINITVNELPSVSASDNGKILQVVSGAWTTVTPVTVYSGSGTPSSGTGNNGDIYIQTA